MATYVQLGRGFRPNYDAASLRHHARRRVAGGSLAVVLVLAVAVFTAGLVFGRADNGAGAQAPAPSSQPMQFYPH